MQSIVDRRYEKQKHFMHRCGVRRLMYLVEGDPLRLLASVTVSRAARCRHHPVGSACGWHFGPQKCTCSIACFAST